MADDALAVKLADRRIPEGGDWLSAAELAEITPEELIRRARALKPLLAANALEAERLRRPVDEVIESLRRSGVFYHFVPKSYGGLEFDIDTFIDAMLPLGEGCGSTAWVTSFCVEHNWMISQFPKEMQDETFGSAFPYVIAPGVTNPPGVASPVEGGYRLTGHWKFGTGVMHADWVLAAGVVPDETPSRVVFCALPAAEVEVIDTWHMDGMIGTGSNDVAVRDVFVPAHRTLNMAEMREGRAPGSKLHSNPIYRMPMLPFLALTAAIPAVGVARSAVNFFRDRMRERVGFGTNLKQAEKPAAQMRLAHADVLTQTAELMLRAVGRENVEVGRRGEATNVAMRIDLRVKVTHAMRMCREAVGIVCEASGAGAHTLDNPLQRALRDVNVMSSHVVYDLDLANELHGRALIGLPPNSPVT